MSLTSTPETIVPMNNTWVGQILTMEVEALNFTHYSVAARPSELVHLMQMVAYVPARDVSYRYFGTLVGAYCATSGRNESTYAHSSRWRYSGNCQVWN